MASRKREALVRSDVPYAELAAQGISMRLFARDVRVASIDHLLTMNRVANRPKDGLTLTR